MPKEKDFKKIIPRIYKCNAENLGLFFFIKAQLQIVPTMSIDLAINNYRKFTGIDEDDWDRMSIRMQYFRMQGEFYKDMKDECAEAYKGTYRPKTGVDKS